jgi:hypothetical protein
MDRCDPPIVNQDDADLGLFDTFGSQRPADQPLQAAGRDPHHFLPVAHIDDERRWRRLGNDAAAESGHYAVLWSGYLTRP